MDLFSKQKLLRDEVIRKHLQTDFNQMTSYYHKDKDWKRVRTNTIREFYKTAKSEEIYVVPFIACIKEHTLFDMWSFISFTDGNYIFLMDNTKPETQLYTINPDGSMTLLNKDQKIKVYQRRYFPWLHNTDLSQEHIDYRANTKVNPDLIKHCCTQTQFKTLIKRIRIKEQLNIV